MAKQDLACAYCPPERAPHGELALVRFQEQGSGPGWNYYACGTCRSENPGLRPLTDRRYPVPEAGR